MRDKQNSNRSHEEEIFTLSELRHLAVNYAISCEKGYIGSFDSWYNNISSKWRKSLLKTE